MVIFEIRSINMKNEQMKFIWDLGNKSFLKRSRTTTYLERKTLSINMKCLIVLLFFFAVKAFDFTSLEFLVTGPVAVTSLVLNFIFSCCLICQCLFLCILIMKRKKNTKVIPPNQTQSNTESTSLNDQSKFDTVIARVNQLNLMIDD